MKALIALLALASSPVFAGYCTPPLHRSQTARHAFVLMHPCPATGLPILPCKGYIIDHKVPLCLCGPDAASNMQWQTVAAAHRKDLIEWRSCRLAKKAP